MSNTPRRRVTMAAGALLAGAAIPIAAAAIAWADATETLSQLEHQGIPKVDAQYVVNAENNGVPVQVSYDGITVVDANQGSDPATQADAETAAGPHDVAVAIYGGSTAAAGVGNTNHDTAIAIGTSAGGASAGSGYGSHDTATAIGDGSAAEAVLGNYDRSTVTGTGSSAYTGGIESSAVVEGSHDTATVTGNDSQAAAGTGEAGVPSSNADTAIVKGDNSSAYAGYGFVHDKAEALGSNLTAAATDHNGETVIVPPPALEATPFADDPAFDLHMPFLP